MKENGFSLIEMVVVLAIIGILTAIVSLQFNEYMQKAHIEAQVKAMYADLMGIRGRALFQKKGASVTLATNQFLVYSSNTVGSSVAPVQQKSLSYPITWNGSAQIDFNERGLVTVPADGSICVDMEGNKAAYDSIVISMTRIQMGKKTGAECKSADIQTK